ncbi:MAG: M23 family metallopeptidase [Spirochaetales bacterium]|nr:M23 family metallopeptidase [Spirochaetales bacterium]
MSKLSRTSVIGIIFLFIVCFCFANSNYYVIKKGDNLYRISKRFNVPLEVLLKVNKIKDPKNVKVGMKIIIPTVHTVKRGDTLYSLSRQYGIAVNELMELNYITNPAQLKVNQQIIIPVARSVVTHDNTTNPAYSDLAWPHPGSREKYNGKLEGVLISGNKGDVIYSVSSGKVIWSGPYRGFGNIVLADSGTGLIFGYLGAETTTVKVGDPVEAGTAIGRLGVYLHQTQAKLLFIVFDKRKRTFLNPETLYTR